MSPRHSSARPADQAVVLVERLKEHQLTLATAESLTAGLISAGIADVPGASAVLVGGAVTYATRAKHEVLGVDADLLSRHGAVDPDVAQQMAVGARKLYSADIGISATGVAGPSMQDGKPVGLVYLGVSLRESDVRSERYAVRRFEFTGSRDEIRHSAARAAWALVLEVVGDSF